MQSISELKATLREVDQSKYPQLSNYTKEDIWRDVFGPGGLYLVSLLAKELELRPNSWVLDLGCGAAESSLYLANTFTVNVVAADLWRDPTENARKIDRRGRRGTIIPMRLDASQPLPFAEEYFDAILCVNNLNFYGTDLAVVDRIARHLKKCGIFAQAANV